MVALNASSEKLLDGVHPDLARVVRTTAAQTLLRFKITEGLRTIERQKDLVARGKSRTMNSRHLPHPSDGLSRAVDVAMYDKHGNITWDIVYYGLLRDQMVAVAKQLDVPIIWGNDWDDDGVWCGPDPDESFVDACHFELNRKRYP